MPARIVPYLIGLIQARNITATFLQRQFGFSHDQLTRTLQRRLNWQRLLVFVVQRLFGVLSGGYLVIDDTTIAKPYAGKLEGASFVYSSLLDKTVYGYQVVVICWTNSVLTIPLGWRFYQKDNRSKVDLVQELLEEVKCVWKIKPRAVLFDTWYAASRLLNQIHSYRWTFVCQIKKNRVVNACRVDQDLTEDSEVLVGPITGWFRGKVLKNEDLFLLTNDLKMETEKMIYLYSVRWRIEEVFRFIKSQLHLEELQARSKIAYQTHLGSCFLSYLILLKEKQARQPDQTLYFIKDEWMLDRRLGRNRINHYVKVLSA